MWLFSHWVTSDSETPWTVAHQAPLSVGFPRQKYWSVLRVLLPKPSLPNLHIPAQTLGPARGPFGSLLLFSSWQRPCRSRANPDAFSNTPSLSSLLTTAFWELPSPLQTETEAPKAAVMQPSLDATPWLPSHMLSSLSPHFWGPMVGASLVASLVTRVVLISGQSTAHGVSAPLRVKRSGQHWEGRSGHSPGWHVECAEQRLGSWQSWPLLVPGLMSSL